jgi:hypothetical protein
MYKTRAFHLARSLRFFWKLSELACEIERIKSAQHPFSFHAFSSELPVRFPVVFLESYDNRLEVLGIKSLQSGEFLFCCPMKKCYESGKFGQYHLHL